MAQGRDREKAWLAVAFPVVMAAEAGGMVYVDVMERLRPHSGVVGLFPLRNASMAIALALVGVVGSLVSILTHELGHAVAAQRAGERVTHLSVGTGQRLLTLHVRGTEVRMHAGPASGCTTHSMGDGLTNRQNRNILLAGPATHLALTVIVLPALLLGPTAGVLAAGFCALNLESFLVNLSTRPPSRTGGVSSDGWRLRQLRGLPPHQTLAELRSHTVHTALTQAPQASAGHLGGALLMAVRSDRADPRLAAGLTLVEQYSLRGRFTDVQRLCDQLLSTDLPPGVARLVVCARADALLSDAVSTGRTLTYEELRDAHAALTDAAGVHGVLHSWALYALVQGDPATAAQLAQRCLTEEPLTWEQSAIVKATLATASRCDLSRTPTAPTRD